jgi:hypothetical protein
MNNYQPTSSLGWIDFSDTDKQKVMKVIEMLQPDSTVDELGVGVVRNALSDAMFPGITTIMTRAKYFFIVPRILQSYISKPLKNITIREFLRLEENEIMQTLAEQNNFDEEKRIIGVSVAKQNQNLPKRNWKELIRKPSTIYWNGIRTYSIYQGDYSLSNLLDIIDGKSHHDFKFGYQAADGETSDDRDAEANEKINFSLPDYSKNWKKEVKIELTPLEANFFKHKVIDKDPQILLSKVLKTRDFSNEFIRAKSFQDMCEMPFVKVMDSDTQNIIFTARDFWKIMYGAHIRYNIILHSRHGSESFQEECEDKWADWMEDMKEFKWDLFNRDLMWGITKQHSKVKRFTENFINNWMDKIQNRNFNTVDIDNLVELQEKNNKSSRSKLNPQSDEKYNKWIGIQQMNFRFGNARTIVNDIVSII